MYEWMSEIFHIRKLGGGCRSFGEKFLIGYNKATVWWV